MLADQSLLSGSKFSDTGYILTCDDKEVNIYDGRTSCILVSEIAVLKVWKCPRTKLWHVLIQLFVTNLNTHTLLLDGPTRTESLNYLYSDPSITKILFHIEVFNHIRPSSVESINNTYELPNIEPEIR